VGFIVHLHLLLNHLHHHLHNHRLHHALHHGNLHHALHRDHLHDDVLHRGHLHDDDLHDAHCHYLLHHKIQNLLLLLDKIKDHHKRQFFSLWKSINIVIITILISFLLIFHYSFLRFSIIAAHEIEKVIFYYYFLILFSLFASFVSWLGVWLGAMSIIPS